MLYKEGMAGVSLLLGWVALRQGERATVRSRAEESLTLYRQMENQGGMAEALCMLGKVEAARGDHAFAQTLL
jgi:hypothetical protein